MTEKTITAKAPGSGTEYTATATTPERSQRTSFTSRMIFEVEIPEKGITYKGFFDARKDAIMGRAKVGKKYQAVGVKATDEVRAFVEECERPIREAEAAEKARIEEIADGIHRDESGKYVSDDGMFSHSYAHDGYVSIDSGLSGLPDNTQGKIGKFPVYLQHPDERIPAELVAGARDFYRAITIARKRDEAAKSEAAKRAREEAKQAHEAPIFARAREIGERVELRRYATDCNDRREECSTDIVVVWAMPDGFTETTRMHTW